MAGIDTFKDNNIQFMHRLVHNGVDAKAKEYRLMPHGFLSYNLPLKYGMSQAKQCIKEVYLSIKELADI